MSIFFLAASVDTVSADLHDITPWAATNNLTLNFSNSEQIIFVDKRRRTNSHIPNVSCGLKHVQNIKILGVTLTNSLSVLPHIHNIVTLNVQTLYASRILRVHGPCDKVIQEIFHSSVLARLSHASPAWWGFARSKDKQIIYGSL